jgi:hypothetical protein
MLIEIVSGSRLKRFRNTPDVTYCLIRVHSFHSEDFLGKKSFTFALNLMLAVSAVCKSLILNELDLQIP